MMRYGFGSFELDEEERLLLRNGARVELGDRAFDLLAALVKTPGRLAAKGDLMDAVWPNLFVTENNLQVQISGLRKALGQDAIATVAGRGYRFTVAVRELGDDRAVGVAAARRETAPGPAGDVDLVGRDEDLAQLNALLRTGALVTLTGPGGIGKTRLAQAVFIGAQARGERAAWVDLAGLSEPSLLAGLVGRAFGVEAPSDSVLAALGREIRGQGALIVLDNAEPLVEAVAGIAGALRAAAPDARLLVTSQARLRLPAEQTYRLEGLTVPEEGPDLADIALQPAPALFLRRARALDRRFALTADNVGAVLRICRRLDGSPLALELAAGRLHLFGAQGLEQRLDERFKLMSEGYRDSPDRHQTLRAVFDWSYGLAPESERRLFARLGVFAGAFSLDWACQVGREGEMGEWAVIEALGHLLDRSLLDIAEGEEALYRLTETARAFALDRLTEAGDLAALEQGVNLYEAAGAAAANRSEPLAAVSAFSTALELQRRLESLGAPADRRLSLLLELGPAVQTAVSPANERCGSVYREALDLAASAGPETRFHAIWGYWHFLCMSGRMTEAAPYAEELARLAPSLTDDGLELEAWHAAFTTHQLLGDAPAVVEAANRAGALYDPHRHHDLAGRFGGHDAGVCALGQGSVALWLTGFPDQARLQADAAVDAAWKTDHGYSRAVGFFYGAITYQALGLAEPFERCATGLIETSDRHDMAVLQTEGEFFGGLAAYRRGEGPAAVEAMRGAFEALVSDGDFGFGMLYAALLADALIGLEGDAEARLLLDRAMGFAAQGQGFFLPELHRLKGVVAARAGDLEGAEAALREALRIARGQHARMLELRAAVALAGFGLAPAAELVSPLLLALGDGEDTPDIAQARRLLT
jgi:predicted ATPase/DNA-binding winged helix-turn-helix (wHTH) protein